MEAGGFEAGAAGAEGSDGGEALPPRILNITVPQVGHLPLMALRPFFMVSSTALDISFLALHLTQYPSGINRCRQTASCGPAVDETLRAGESTRQQANSQLATCNNRTLVRRDLWRHVRIFVQTTVLDGPIKRVPFRLHLRPQGPRMLTGVAVKLLLFQAESKQQRVQ